MPELPEVETTVRYLRERIVGERISDVAVLWPKSVDTHSAKAFTNALTEAICKATFRRGKFIGIELKAATPLYLFIHLRMSGSLDVVSSKNEVHQHDRVVIHFKGGRSLRFNDTRKFGRMYLYEDPSAISNRLGVEPLSTDFTVECLSAILHAKKRTIKPLLLDQSLIAGLGNIYVDECLWKAQIHPQTPAHRVPPKKIPLLHKAIEETLTEAIDLLGTDFGDNVVDGGMYQPQVYGREGSECHRCKRPIKRTIVGQRGTHYCPSCQRR
jgi:formamidopyrimidine-DNA glycosylase